MSYPDLSVENHKLRHRIAALEAELASSKGRTLEALEARDYNFEQHQEALARIAELEAERDRAMNLLGAASVSNATLEQTVRAANALVSKLRVVHNDPRYQGVWQLSQAHFGPYNGPKYNEELDALIAALAEEEKKP